MTLDELADLSADKLKALSTEQLTEILKPFFPTTRPELAPRKSVRKVEAIVNLSPEKRAAFALLSEEGVDLGFLRRKRK